MAKYKAYSEYKDSGVEWLGEIPAHWNIKRLGQFFEERREKVSDKDYPALSVTMQGIIPQLDTAAKTEAGDNRKLVLKDDFVINSRSDRKGSAGVSRFNGSVSLISIVMRPKGINPRFAHYLLRCRPFQEEFYRYGKGIVADLWSTNSSELKNIHLPEIQFSESEIITIFLDHETAKIDNLIEKQQQLIELLKEKRHAVISHVVTKGLNPDVPMKDSGVEWLGEVPEHWSYTRIKYVSLLNPSKSKLTYDNINECTFLPMEKLKNNSVITDENRLIKDVINGYTYFKDGDLLVAKVTPCFENKNIAIAKNLTNAIGFGSSEIYVIRTNKYIDVDYLLYRLQENNFMCAATGAMIGAGGLKRIPSDFLLNYQIVIPPKNEMKQISEYLINQENQYNALENQAIIGIQLLQERRTALISAAVTGKIDVRNWAAPGEQAKAESPAEAFA